ncbi:MAG: hypothetical protein C4334_14250 [Pyrinomonas sp.]
MTYSEEEAESCRYANVNIGCNDGSACSTTISTREDGQGKAKVAFVYACDRSRAVVLKHMRGLKEGDAVKVS